MPEERITVSREALRADLAELELRIMRYFDEQLRHKADVLPVAEAAIKLDKLDRGEWTATHRRALIELIEEQTAENRDRAWSKRERVMGVFAFAVTASTFALSIFLAIGART